MKVFEPRDCKRTRALLDDFLSGQLSIESNQEILSHLEVCAACSEQKSFREAQRRMLQESWNSQAVPSKLEERIRSTVTRRFSFPVSPAWAAGFLLVAVSFAVLLHFSRIGTGEVAVVDHYEAMIQDHFNCKDPVPANQEHCPLKESREALEVALEEAGDYRVEHVNQCRFRSISFLHYIFQDGDRRFSVMLERRRPNQSLPELAGEIQRVLDGVRIHFVIGSSLSVTSFESPDYFVYMIGEETHPARTRALAEKLLPPLKRALIVPSA